MMTQDYKDPDWYKKRFEKTLSSVVSGAKKLTDSSLKKITHLQDCSRSLINEYSKLKKESEILQKTKVVEEALISQFSEGIFVVDANCKILLINERARNVFGFTQRDKVLNTNYFENIVFTHGDMVPISWKNDPICRTFEKNVNNRITLLDDMYCLRKDGSTFPVTASLTPFTVNGVIQAISVTIYDATDEKQTADIRSDFVSVASHQMKTPLTISNTHTELLLREAESADEKNHLEEILYGNKKIEELVNRFYIISKIGSGTLSLFKQHHDINQILDDTLHELSMDIKNKKLHIVRLYEPSCIGYVDAVLLRIAIHNIISNAIKYTEKEGTITIKTRHERNAINVSISDTGCGIPENEHSHVFMKFYRGLKTYKNTAGTGVGLYITKAIVDECDGNITFESVENKGTTFSVMLPISNNK